MSNIHPTAIVHPGAVIGDDCEIGAYSIIGSRVKMGRGNRVAPHVVIEGNTVIGDGNEFFQFASIGSKPQDLKFHGEDSTLEIGNKNIIREYVTLQPGTSGGGMRTVIGNQNLFMASTHLGHDGKVGDGNIFANCATLAGHVTVGNYVTVGGLSAIHQFVSVGDLAFVGGGAMLTHDAPPFCMVQGDRAKLIGLNRIGLQRKGNSAEDISDLQSVFRSLFLKKEGTLNTRLEKLLPVAKSRISRDFLEFIKNAKRGVVSLRRGKGAEEEE